MESAGNSNNLSQKLNQKSTETQNSKQVRTKFINQID